MPFICGVIRPKIILPEEQYTKKELEIILLHELEYYKQKDIFWKPKAVFLGRSFRALQEKADTASIWPLHFMKTAGGWNCGYGEPPLSGR